MPELSVTSSGREWVDALDVISKSLRFDLIFKLELAIAWASGRPAEVRIAEEAYLEMVRARNGFRESDPPRSGPEAFIDAFRRTAASIRERGYDEDAPPVPLDADGEVLNGAHRIAACAAYARPCLVERLPARSTGGSRMEAFLRERMSPAVVAWGILAYSRRFPHGRLAERFAQTHASELPFPDWAERARALRWRSAAWRLRELLFRAKACARFGDARKRALKRVDECRHRATAPDELARYWEERPFKA